MGALTAKQRATLDMLRIHDAGEGVSILTAAAALGLERNTTWFRLARLRDLGLVRLKGGTGPYARWFAVEADDDSGGVSGKPAAPASKQPLVPLPAPVVRESLAGTAGPPELAQDWCTRRGAAALAAQIADYWIARGYEAPKFEIKSIGESKPPLHGLRSDMRNGLPAAAAVAP